MADAVTTNWDIVKPEVGASADTWGSKQNSNRDVYDTIFGGVVTTTGSANAYVASSGLGAVAYSTQAFRIKANFTNSGAATLNLDGLGAKNIYKQSTAGPVAVASGDIVSGQIYLIAYDGTQFQIIGPASTQHQPLDATLTALAALSWSSGNALVQFTAADTVSLTLAPSVTSVTASGAVTTATISLTGAAAAPQITHGSDTDTGLEWATSDVFNIWINNAARFRFVSTAFSPATNDAAALGSTSRQWSDVFLAEGGVINWDNGDATITQTGNVVELAGAGWAASLVPSSETSGTLTTASRNRKVNCSGGVTLDDGVFATDEWQVFDAGAADRTFTRAAGLTMYVNGTDSASATLPANTTGGAIWRSATVVVLSGAFY